MFEVLRKNKVDTYKALVFAPDYSATVLAAKICTNSYGLMGQSKKKKNGHTFTNNLL